MFLDTPSDESLHLFTSADKEAHVPKIETLMLANHAEALNGLLYITGGGWTEHWRAALAPGAPPPPSHIGIAVGISVRWLETNRRFPISVKIESEDAGQEVLRIEGAMESGRPLGIPGGIDLTSALAVNAEIGFPHPGGYRLVATVGGGLEVGGDERTVSFRVHDQSRPQDQMVPPTANPG